LKTLILTEKPSVAMDFAKALAATSKKDGFLESDSFIITWAVGHLLELYEPSDYNPAWKQWNYAHLPIVPERFQYKPLAKTKKQLSVIANLLKRTDIASIVIATDAGREGEVIARTVLYHSYKTNGIPIKRFWSSQALTPPVVQAEIKNLKPAAKYDRLWQAGQARQIADWLIGMNCTRAATLKLGSLYTVGRVQTATLALLVDRTREREKFVTKFYYVVLADFEHEGQSWKGIWTGANGDRLDTQTEADAIIARAQGRPGTVKECRQEKKTEQPPLLYSLTELQRAANQKLGFTAQKTLSIAQDLYENDKCISYPRSDARVMGSSNVPLVANLVASLSQNYREIFKGTNSALINISNKRVFDDSKLTDHHALIPLKPLPSDVTDPKKQKIYDLILRRFAAAFYPPYIYNQTTLDVSVGGELFRTTGRQVLFEGWHGLYPENSQPLIPVLQPGTDVKTAKLWSEQRETQPPQHYTEATLLRDMSNPAKYVQDKTLQNVFKKGEVGLGTQATRAAVIENLIERGYVERKKKSLVATDKAKTLIDFLRTSPSGKVLASAQETARWEQQLEAVSQGLATGSSFLDDIKGFSTKAVTDIAGGKMPPGLPAKRPTVSSKTVGICPKCKSEVIEQPKGFSCSGWKTGCDFIIWKTICSRLLTREEAQTLLSSGYVGPLSGFISKKGKLFEGRLCLRDGKVIFDFGKVDQAGHP